MDSVYTETIISGRDDASVSVLAFHICDHTAPMTVIPRPSCPIGAFPMRIAFSDPHFLPATSHLAIDSLTITTAGPPGAIS
jgi:hypothetical protein